MTTAPTLSPADRLLAFAHRGRVPNILLHGPPGSGKSRALDGLLEAMYGESGSRSELVLVLDCARDRGTTFVREDLKHFARGSQTGVGAKNITFRSVIIRSADMLTHDAQSALRRCIEVYSKSTRFFLLAHDTSKLLRPVLSRFCAVHFHLQGAGSHAERVAALLPPPPHEATRRGRLKRLVTAASKSRQSVLSVAERLYEQGYTGRDVTGLEAVKGLPASERLRIDRAVRTMVDERLAIAYVLSRLFRAVR